MKYARSVAHGILGTLVFIFLLALWMLIVDERCSRNASENEISWEQTQQNIGGDK